MTTKGGDMTAHGYSDNKQAILKRLARIEGQVRGVTRMVDDDKYCIDVMTQINAVQAALDRVALELLRDHARHCLAGQDLSPEQSQQKADELVGAMKRMLSR